MTRRAAWAGALVACLVTVSGCSQGDTPADRTPSPSASAQAQKARCDKVTSRLLASVQQYVDGYGAPLATSGGADNRRPKGSEVDLRSALEDTKLSLQNLGCDFPTFQDDFRNGLEGVRTRGPVAHAVLLRLEASMTGAVGVAAETRTVRPGDDLARTVAGLAPGSVVRLVAGRYRLPEALVLLQGVTLRGKGRDRTTLVSAAPDADVLVLTDGRVELSDLTVRHTGTQPASVVMAGPTSSLVLTRARVAGARTGRPGQGGSGVMMTAQGGLEAHRGTTLELTGTELVDNDAAGVLLSGGHRASIRTSRFVRNGQCGVCFTGQSSGAVRGSRFDGNGAGAAVLDTARPLFSHDVFDGGQVGLQVSGRAAPLVKDVTVRGAARAAMIFSGTSRGRVDGSTCERVPYGIVVSPQAYPYLGDNSCAVARSR